MQKGRFLIKSPQIIYFSSMRCRITTIKKVMRYVRGVLINLMSIDLNYSVTILCDRILYHVQQ